jgi:hypothetical protein
MRRFIICLGLFAAVVTLAAQAASPVPVRVIAKTVTPSYNAATLSFTLSRQANVTLNISIDGRNSLPLRRPQTASSHQFKTGCLTTNRHYYYSLTTPTTSGSRVIDRGDFTTESVPDQRVEATVVMDHLIIGGQPCFVIASRPGLYLCPPPNGHYSVDAQMSLGIDFLTWTGSVCYKEAEEGSRILHQALQGKTWFLWDSPPNPNYQLVFPEALDYQPPSSGEYPNHWVMETRYEGCGSSSAESLYQEVSAYGVPHRQPKMLWLTIGHSRARCLTPAKLSVMFWLPVVAGNCGVIYTETDYASSQDFDVLPAIVVRAQLLANQVATLRPALCGRRVATRKVGGSIRLGAWRYQGTTYVVAINTRQKATMGRFKVAGFSSGKAAVMWEGRRVKITKGVIRDKFKKTRPVHIYRLS